MLWALALLSAVGTVAAMQMNMPAKESGENNCNLSGRYDGAFTAFAQEGENQEEYQFNTLGMVSVDGKYLLMVTNIDQVENYNSVGYEINGETFTFYTSLAQ